MGIKTAVTRVAANVVTGNQTISTTDLGGLTPKAVVLIATRAVTDGTAADGAGWYVGFSDGSTHISQSYESQHAQASMDDEFKESLTNILEIYDGTADNVIDGVATFVSFQANGVTINWSNEPSSAFLITAIFFAGSDLSAKVSSVALGNTADALIAITDTGFEADIVLTMLMEGTATLGGTVSMGIVHNNRSGTVTQRTIAHKQRNGFSASRVASVMRDTDCVARVVESTETLDFAGAAQSFDSAGFDVQLSGGRAPANHRLGYLSLRLGASPVVSSKVYTYSTPTSTGSNTDSGPGFEPQLVMYLLSRTAVAGTIEIDADGGPFGLLVADANEVYSNSISDADGAADSDTQSLSDDRINLPTDTGASGQEASFTSFGASGVTWNWTTTDSTARQWGALVIQAESGAAQQVITGSAVVNTNAFGQPAITVGSVTVIPSGISNGNSFGQPTVANQGGATQVITGTGITNTNEFGQPSITVGQVTIQPNGIVHSNNFGNPTISVGQITVIPNGISNVNQFGQPTISVEAIEIIPDGISNVNAFGQSVITVGSVTIQPSGISNTNNFGQPTISVGQVDIEVTGIENSNLFGEPTITLISYVSGTGIASNNQFGLPTIDVGDVTVVPTGISNSNLFGLPSVANEGGPTQIITGTGISNTTVFGQPTITPGTVTVIVSGIDDTNQLGSPVIAVGQVVISGSGIASVETFGQPTISSSVEITVSGISNTNNFGQPTISQIIQPSGIAANNGIGQPDIDVETVTIIVSGIASGIGFGTPRVVQPSSSSGSGRRFGFTRIGRI